MKKPINHKNKIYFSGSLHGVKPEDPEFSYKLVQHMKNIGFDVLSEHVAARNSDELDKIYFEKTKFDRKDPKNKDLWYHAYETDMKWVDESDYLIAVVDGPSHGVGMEIMRALLKEERGLKKTNILCLVNINRIKNLSWMIRGVPKKYKNFNIETYKDLNSAINIVDIFLKNK